MIQDAIDRIPTEHAFNIVAAVLIVALVAAGFAAGYWGRHTYVTTTRTVRVERSWGTPTQSFPATQISPQLAQAGMSVCDYYQSRNTLVCH